MKTRTLLLAAVAALAVTTAHAKDPMPTEHFDLLIKNGLHRQCELQLEETKLPCERAWYVVFDDDSKSVQFNRPDSRPMDVAFFGTLSDKPDTVTVTTVLVGEQQYEAARGQCLLGKEIAQCQALLPDGRLVVARINCVRSPSAAACDSAR